MYQHNPDGIPSILRKMTHFQFFKHPSPPAPGPLIMKNIKYSHSYPIYRSIIKHRPPKPAIPSVILHEQPSMIPKTNIRRIQSFPASRREVLNQFIPVNSQNLNIPNISSQVPRRQIIVQKAPPQIINKPNKNVIIDYIPVPPRKERVFKRLGVIPANPTAYVSRYGSSLLDSQSLLRAAKKLGIYENISPPAIVNIPDGTGRFEGDKYKSGVMFTYPGGTEYAGETGYAYGTEFAYGTGYTGATGYADETGYANSGRYANSTRYNNMGYTNDGGYFGSSGFSPDSSYKSVSVKSYGSADGIETVRGMNSYSAYPTDILGGLSGDRKLNHYMYTSGYGIEATKLNRSNLEYRSGKSDVKN